MFDVTYDGGYSVIQNVGNLTFFASTVFDIYSLTLNDVTPYLEDYNVDADTAIQYSISSFYDLEGIRA